MNVCPVQTWALVLNTNGESLKPYKRMGIMPLPNKSTVT